MYVAKAAQVLFDRDSIPSLLLSWFRARIHFEKKIHQLSEFCRMGAQLKAPHRVFTWVGQIILGGSAAHRAPE